MLVLTRSAGEGMLFRGDTEARLEVTDVRRSKPAPSRGRGRSGTHTQFASLELTGCCGRIVVDLTQQGAVEFQLGSCDVKVTVSRFNGKFVTLGIEAPSNVKVLRSELQEH